MFITKSDDKNIVIVEDKDIGTYGSICAPEIHFLIMTKKAFADETLYNCFIPCLANTKGQLLII